MVSKDGCVMDMLWQKEQRGGLMACIGQCHWHTVPNRGFVGEFTSGPALSPGAESGLTLQCQAVMLDVNGGGTSFCKD